MDEARSTGLHIRGMCSDFLRSCKPQLIALKSYHKAVPLYKKVRRRLDIGLPWLYTHCQQERHAGVITFCSSFRLIFHKTYLMADVNVPYPLISGWECLGLKFRMKTHIMSFSTIMWRRRVNTTSQHWAADTLVPTSAGSSTGTVLTIELNTFYTKCRWIQVWPVLPMLTEEIPQNLPTLRNRVISWFPAQSAVNKSEYGRD